MIIAPLVLLVIACPAAAPAPTLRSPHVDSGLARVVELAREGSYAAGLSAAESLSSPLERAQGRLFVFHQAGDLGAALQAGIDGLHTAPADLWLLERVCYIAISLRATPTARAYCDRFERSVDASRASESDADLKRWRSLAADYKAQVEELEEAARARARALLRARWTVYAALLVFSALLLRAAMQRAQSGAGGCREM